MEKGGEKGRDGKFCEKLRGKDKSSALQTGRETRPLRTEKENHIEICSTWNSYGGLYKKKGVFSALKTIIYMIK